MGLCVVFLLFVLERVGGILVIYRGLFLIFLYGYFVILPIF